MARGVLLARSLTIDETNTRSRLNAMASSLAPGDG